MTPDPTVDDHTEAPACATDYDTSEMLRQVFLRALTVPLDHLAAPGAVRVGTDPVPRI
ncbi:hypothetical protein ACFV7Q_07755 [Streptomyces sp. NPDC059851]|uniref:hypothetical protein n=1 Tax=Streptomyces sp. NPDC059851 TaxID=3346971 RepID=UPI003668182B